MRSELVPWYTLGLILDIGCGEGELCSRVAFGDYIGIDVSREAITKARLLHPRWNFFRHSAEYIPFTDGEFDSVIAGVSLPYMDIPLVLAEVKRVLRPGGTFWCSLHPLSHTLEHLFRSIRHFVWKDMIFRSYVLLNGLYFHFTGKLFRFPGGRIESFQTKRGMRIAMERAGLTSPESEYQFYSSGIKSEKL